MAPNEKKTGRSLPSGWISIRSAQPAPKAKPGKKPARAAARVRAKAGR